MEIKIISLLFIVIVIHLILSVIQNNRLCKMFGDKSVIFFL